MTDTEKLSLAMEAIEAADKLVPQACMSGEIDGRRWCRVCERYVGSGDGGMPHRDYCTLARFIELRKKLEESR